MIDFYGLPSDFPGLAELPQHANSLRKVGHLEKAWSLNLENRRFLPYLSLHEFEALLLAGPEELSAVLGMGSAARKVLAGLFQDRAPEEINDGKDTHPAARILNLAPGFQKSLDGPVAAQRIGLEAMRRRCPHFDGWLAKLEEVARS